MDLKKIGIVSSALFLSGTILALANSNARLNLALRNQESASYEYSHLFNNLKEAIDLYETSQGLLEDADGQLRDAQDRLNQSMDESRDLQQQLEDSKDVINNQQGIIDDQQDIIDDQKQTISDQEDTIRRQQEDIEENNGLLQDIADAFGITINAQSGASLYGGLQKLETAKYLVSANLGDETIAEEYRQVLDEKESEINRLLSFYPDLPPAGGVITSRFGPRTYEFNGQLRTDTHNGVDIANNDCPPIRAAASGVVFEVHNADDNSLGLYVKIDHGNGFVTWYGHMSRILVVPGQQVSKGQTIGIMGMTGAATGPHIHIEVFFNGSRMDPLSVLRFE